MSTTLPSGRRAEKLPAVPCTRSEVSISFATASSSSLTSVAVRFGHAHVSTSGFTQFDGVLAAQQARATSSAMSFEWLASVS